MRQWETACENVLENYDDSEREVRFTRVCEAATFARKSLCWDDLQNYS